MWGALLVFCGRGCSPFSYSVVCERVFGVPGAASWRAPMRKRPWLNVAGVLSFSRYIGRVSEIVYRR